MSAFSRPLACAAWALQLLPAAAIGAPVAATRNSTGQASVLKSLSVIKRSDLDFGELIVTGAGTAVIDPTAGTLAVTGPITPLGTTAHAATFTATGSKNSVVHIKLPTAAVTLTRVGGGGTMTVTNWTVDGSANRKIPLNSAFNFNVGGTLNVGAGQPDGTYAGTFTITVQYP
jgi:hypothetical protein